MSHYNLYESLHLDPSLDTGSLANRIEELKQSGTLNNPGGMEELNIALAVLGNGHRKRMYDQRLQDPDAPTMDVAALRALAEVPDPTQPAAGSSPSPASSWASSWASSGTPSTNTEYNAWGHPKGSAPAAAAPATTSFVSDAPQLPDNADVKTMWKRMPTIVRATGILSGVSIVACLLIVFSSLIYPFAIKGNSPAGWSQRVDVDQTYRGMFEDIEYNVNLTVQNSNRLMCVILTAILAIVILAVESWWLNSIMKGTLREAPLLISIQAFAIAVGCFAHSIVLFMGGIWMAFLILLVALCTLATGIIILTKRPRMWFKGKVIVSRPAAGGMSFS